MKYLITLFFLFFLSFSSFAQRANPTDRLFGTNGILIGPEGYSASLAVLPDDRFLVGGRLDSANSSAVIRYRLNGIVDSSFGVAGIAQINLPSSSTVTGIIPLPNQKILCMSSVDGVDSSFFLTRLHPDGDLDNSFGVQGLLSLSYGENLHFGVQSDGKIILVGENSYIIPAVYPWVNNDIQKRLILTRLHADGQLDSTFGNHGIVIFSVRRNTFSNSILIQPDDKIVIAGAAGYSGQIWQEGEYGPVIEYYNVSNPLAARFTANGQPDSSFNGNGRREISIAGPASNYYGRGVQQSFSSCRQQSDSKLTFLGTEYSGSAYPYTFAYRMFANGAVDNMVAQIVAPEYYERRTSFALLLQPDGKMLWAGNTHDFNASIRYPILLRFSHTGIPDAQFARNGCFVDSSAVHRTILAIELQSNSRVLALIPHAGRWALTRFFTGLPLGDIDFAEQAPELVLYPNPVTDAAFLRYSLPREEVISLRLFDSQGKLLQTFMQHERQAIGDYEINLPINADLPQGIYFLEFSSPNGNKTIQIRK